VGNCVLKYHRFLAKLIYLKKKLFYFIREINANALIENKLFLCRLIKKNDKLMHVNIFPNWPITFLWLLKL